MILDFKDQLAVDSKSNCMNGWDYVLWSLTRGDIPHRQHHLENEENRSKASLRNIIQEISRIKSGLAEYRLLVLNI